MTRYTVCIVSCCIVMSCYVADSSCTQPRKVHQRTVHAVQHCRVADAHNTLFPYSIAGGPDAERREREE